MTDASRPIDPVVFVQPENELERRVCADPAWVIGSLWGAPRPGHPEGTVALHVHDVLANVERIAPRPDPDRGRLRFIAIVHDSFKGDVDRSKPKTGENHHAMRARRFAERYTDDIPVLDVIELHDHAYIAWRHGTQTGDWPGAILQAEELLDRLGPNLGLFMRFYRADNEVEGKTSEHRAWFSGLAGYPVS
jgi:hypothetical protein